MILYFPTIISDHIFLGEGGLPAWYICCNAILPLLYTDKRMCPFSTMCRKEGRNKEREGSSLRVTHLKKPSAYCTFTKNPVHIISYSKCNSPD